MTSANNRAVTWLFVGLLAILAVAYTAVGFRALVFDIGSSYPIDLRLRWIEERLVWNRIDPQTAGHPDEDLPATHAGMKTLGGSYPPWAYGTGLVLVPPIPWQAVRWYTAILDAGALWILCGWAFTQTRRYGALWAAAAIASVLAVFPIAICLSYGQYTIVITACLALADLLLDRHTTPGDALAGVLLGVALVKPQLGALFALAVLLEARVVSVATCAAFVMAASGVTWLFTGSDPLTMLATSAREASAFSFLSHNPLVHIAESWFGFRWATAVLGIVGLVIALVLLLSARSSPRIVRWAMCATVAMFWGYRKHYDVPLLIFLLMGLLLAALGKRKRFWWIVYAVAGVTLWAPLRDAQWNAPVVVQWVDAAVWTVATGLLWSNARSERQLVSTR